MLVVTSVLLLAAVGFLVVALVTGSIWLAWGSIAASAAAALVLLVRWWRLHWTRGRHRSAGQAPGPDHVGSSQRAPEPATSQPDTSEPDTPQPETPQPETPQPETPQPGGAAAARQPGEPAEEDTDAADLLLVCEVDDEVLVVDERPRYHLPGCRWVGTRTTEALPVRQARELGFTPCAGCGPDAELATRHRATSTG
ncbi:MAG: hypothetical protein GEU83_03840 [Pseudonocardiaceae bacterium]|nr:hypothetical protein [Pseudonocardiaceae bacterium]